MSSDEEGVKMVRMAAAQIDTLCPQVRPLFPSVNVIVCFLVMLLMFVSLLYIILLIFSRYIFKIPLRSKVVGVPLKNQKSIWIIKLL